MERRERFKLVNRKLIFVSRW